MNRRTSTIPTGFFDDLYTADPDPWGFRSSAYERAKYADTLSVLMRERYGTALEIGCSIGVFTRLLARRCDRVIATEPSAPARIRAMETCADAPNVVFTSNSLPGDVPIGYFDLIVLSEVLYYLDAADAAAAFRTCCDRLAPSGETVLCHWLGETDYPLTGLEAAEIATAEAKRRGWTVRTFARTDYRLDHIHAEAA